MSDLFLDHIDKTPIDRSICANELNTLMMLRVGLLHLANAVDEAECTFDFERSNTALVACHFHWFAVSVCNYARLVGVIRGLSKKDFARSDFGEKTRFSAITKSVNKYIKSIGELSNVLGWRNKVGAHFAITYPWENDNLATLEMSAISSATYCNGRFVVGAFQMMRKNASGVHVSEIPSWSLTETFEKLIPRYWPDIRIPSRQERVEKWRAKQEAQGEGRTVP